MSFTSWLKLFACNPAPRKPIRRSRLPLLVERLEDRLQPSVSFYSTDGSGNNTTHPTWGTAGTDLIRLAPAAYADGVSSPSLPNDQSARAISNILNDQTDPSNTAQDLNTLDGNNMSDFGYAFGQFMDHDMDLTNDGGANFPISVSASDPIGPSDLPFTRSQTDPSTGTGLGNPAQQVTSVTSYLDLSQVYGSDPTTADALRTHIGGLMKTSPGGMLPLDNSTYFTTPVSLQNLNGAPTSDLFATGDVRGNENIELTALQTLFVRNHNLLASQLQQQHPTWSDEQLFQEARKLNIAEYQRIIYTQYLPDLLGANALPAYQGYNPNVNATIANEFSTVAFRFGHSMLSGSIAREDNNGLPIADVNAAGSSIELSQDFFDPYILNPSGTLDPLTGHSSSDIGPVLKADADGVAQKVDLLAIRDVRNLLFGNYGAGGQDLMARDVQRDRDNGIPDYNSLRASLGLPRVTSFAQITSNVQVQQELQAAYGNVNDIDAFEGGLAEDHVPGSDLGPLFQKILVNQFTRLRDGDRFFYLSQSYTPAEQHLLQQGSTLGQIIEANTPIRNLQNDVFVFKASINGTIYLDKAGMGGPQTSGEPGQPGVPVQLKDDAGNVLATTVTDRQGNYRFDQQTGLAATGNYSLSLDLPASLHQTTIAPATILISRGDVNMKINFGVHPTNVASPPPMNSPKPPGPNGGNHSASPSLNPAAATLMAPPVGNAPTTPPTITTQAPPPLPGITPQPKNSANQDLEGTTNLLTAPASFGSGQPDPLQTGKLI